MKSTNHQINIQKLLIVSRFGLPLSAIFEMPYRRGPGLSSAFLSIIRLKVYEHHVNPPKVKIIKVQKLKQIRFKCSKCFRSFGKRYMLISHLKYFHKNSQFNDITGIAKKSLIDTSSLWTNKTKSIKCSACKRVFPSATDWKAHKKCRKEHDIFECIECKVKLKSSLMSDHLARVHGVSINDQSHPSK